MSESRRYHVTTFGCQMNKADSERMAGILENMGMSLGSRSPAGRPSAVQHLHYS